MKKNSAENYILVLDNPPLKSAIRVLRILNKYDGVIVEMILFSIKITDRDSKIYGVLGGVIKNHDSFLLKGYIPLPRRPKYEFFDSYL